MVGMMQSRIPLWKSARQPRHLRTLTIPVDILSSVEFAEKFCERFTKSSIMVDLDDAIAHFRKEDYRFSGKKQGLRCRYNQSWFTLQTGPLIIRYILAQKTSGSTLNALLQHVISLCFWLNLKKIMASDVGLTVQARYHQRPLLIQVSRINYLVIALSEMATPSYCSRSGLVDQANTQRISSTIGTSMDGCWAHLSSRARV